MLELGPKTLCCGKAYTLCACPEVEIGAGGKIWELPPLPEKPISATIPSALYPGTPESWHAYFDKRGQRRWMSGFEVIDEMEE